MYTWDITATNNNDGNDNEVAPFIMKTYHMVSDPSTDHLIAWGRGNNSFIVVDPIEFSRQILPSNFKHNNFSSFVRQLNTYGFKKVDPDRWEFANEWFLRGQKHLLKNIVRRKHSPSHQQQIVIRRSGGGDGASEKEEMAAEIERMKKEQREMERDLQEMTRRLEATERRPEQMVAFLCRVAEDPEILTRMVAERERRSGRRQICSGGGEKKRRLITTSSSPLGEAGAAATTSDSGKTKVEEWSGSQGVASSSPETEAVCGSSSSTDDWSPGFCSGGGMERMMRMGYGKAAAEHGGDGGDVSGFCGVSAVDLAAERRPPPYPFSLFGGGI